MRKTNSDPMGNGQSANRPLAISHCPLAIAHCFAVTTLPADTFVLFAQIIRKILDTRRASGSYEWNQRCHR
jgi:hypothetical protein